MQICPADDREKVELPQVISACSALRYKYLNMERVVAFDVVVLDVVVFDVYSL